MILLTGKATWIIFASKAISALDLSWPLMAPSWPHLLTTLFSQELDVLNSLKRAEKLSLNLAASRGLSSWKPECQAPLRPQGLGAGLARPAGGQVWIRSPLGGLRLGLSCVPCADTRISAERCLSLVILTDSKNEFHVQSAKSWEIQKEEEGQRTSESLHPWQKVKLGCLCYFYCKISPFCNKCAWSVLVGK